MDINMGELFAEGFLTGAGAFLAGVWQALLENPLLMVLFGLIIVGGIVLRVRPRRRRR